jgi:hypothetical protein
VTEEQVVARLEERIYWLREDVTSLREEVRSGLAALNSRLDAALNNGLGGRVRELEVGLVEIRSQVRTQAAAWGVLATAVFHLIILLLNKLFVH